MSNQKILTISWTENALDNATSIRLYLEEKYTKREIESFYSLLSAFEEAVSIFPQLYPQTNNSKIRRAVLSKVLSAFYRISKNEIEVLAIIDNRCDLSEWL
jgi:plasmid stabilization system protein ParE